MREKVRILTWPVLLGTSNKQNRQKGVTWLLLLPSAQGCVVNMIPRTLMYKKRT